MEAPYKTFITRHPSAIKHLTELPQTPALANYLALADAKSRGIRYPHMGPAITLHQASPEAIEMFTSPSMSANVKASHEVAAMAAAIEHACKELGLLPPSEYVEDCMYTK